tara:strand:+ start:552 stop:974 length:423 start_codon:yes stop_codon:yes gene_type:complete
MIKYNLNCKKNHEFESWFSSSREFEKLKKNKMLECIYCHSSEVEKSIMSPTVLNTKKEKKKNEHKEEFVKIKKKLLNIRKFVEKNFEFVGSNFANKAREIYYNKYKNKNIYGVATKKEEEDLLDEGVEITSIPWVNKKDN